MNRIFHLSGWSLRVLSDDTSFYLVVYLYGSPQVRIDFSRGTISDESRPMTTEIYYDELDRVAEVRKMNSQAIIEPFSFIDYNDLEINDFQIIVTECRRRGRNAKLILFKKDNVGFAIDSEMYSFLFKDNELIVCPMAVLSQLIREKVEEEI